MSLSKTIIFIFISFFSFNTLNAQENCPLEITTTAINCSNFTMTVQNPSDQQFFWSVNDIFQNHIGEEFTFQADSTGTYIICSSYETTDCPSGVLGCDTVIVTPNCFADCTLEVSVEEISCRSFNFLSTDNLNLDWTINGEAFIDEPINFINYVAPVPGTYEICGTIETTDCPNTEVFCHTIIVTEDCFPDDCYFIIDITEYNCQSYDISASHDRELYWTINQEPYGQGSQNSITFIPEESGYYQVCGLLETPDCPNGQISCHSIFIDEDCFTTEDCTLNIETTEIDCSTYRFVVQDSIDASFFWSVNWESQNTSSDFFTFVAQEAGDYVICGGYETPDCPSGVVVCDTISVSADCFDTSDCILDIITETHDCKSFSLVMQNSPTSSGNFWSVNGIGQNETSVQYNFQATEAGEYIICGGYETPDCPNGVIVCDTISVSADCFVDPCAFDIQLNEFNCNSFSLIASEDYPLYWTVNQEPHPFGNGVSGIDFVVDEPGIYEVCGILETSDCPNAEIVCQTIIVDEDCF